MTQKEAEWKASMLFKEQQGEGDSKDGKNGKQVSSRWVHGKQLKTNNNVILKLTSMLNCVIKKSAYVIWWTLFHSEE